MKMTWSIALVIVAVSAAVNAQSAKEMDKPMMGDRTHVTYTGCIESVNHGGTFLLTHLADDHHMTMGHDEMMKKNSGMAKRDESAASSEMHGDHMMPGSLVLMGPSNLKKHVGQKVTVTGSVSKGSMGGVRNDQDTLTVGSLKVITKACS
jgi:hypothetical protein